jgi:hypothetical protein
MTDQELRAMIRDAIARRVGADTVDTVRLKPDTTGFGETGIGETGIGETGLRETGMHASHSRLSFLRSGDDDGQCLIEPAVRCNHCAYCLSLGH